LGFIDKTGKIVIEAKYLEPRTTDLGVFKNGVALVGSLDYEKVITIDKTGKELSSQSMGDYNRAMNAGGYDPYRSYPSGELMPKQVDPKDWKSKFGYVRKK
jgi:WG containing repeat